MVGKQIEAIHRKIVARVSRCIRRPAASWPNVSRSVLEVRDLAALKKAMGWTKDPILEGDYLEVYAGVVDLNDRRIRDAEVIAAACINSNAKTVLEIGTSTGQGTALIAQNTPNGTVHTVNIPPEEIADGGIFVTGAPSRDEIGAYYREKGCKNVRQIFANTKTWEPDIGAIDVAFIDGCHDADFVFNDTEKVLRYARPGTIILWHDFDPSVARVHEWIADVCVGVDLLYRRRLIRGNILHLRDSWVGLYRVPG